MFGVRDEGVQDEGMHETENGLLYIRKRKEMSTNGNGVFSGENRMRCVRFHDPVQQQLRKQNKNQSPKVPLTTVFLA